MHVLASLSMCAIKCSVYNGSGAWLQCDMDQISEMYVPPLDAQCTLGYIM